MSLAIRDSDSFQEEVKGKPLGHTPYLSPEVLENWFAQGQGEEAGPGLSCDQLKKADVYALGLVMWEIARRCYIQGESYGVEDGNSLSCLERMGVSPMQ